MVDPLTSLGVAGNIITIVDVGYKVLKDISHLYRSESGELEELVFLKHNSEALLKIGKHLQSILKPEGVGRALTPLESETARLAADCSDVATEFIEIIDRLSPKNAKSTAGSDDNDSKRAKGWDAVRRAIKGVWMRKDIDRLQTRLDTLRQSLMTSILINLREDVASVSNRISASSTTSGWGEAKALHNWLATQRKEDEQWRANLLRVVDQINERILKEIHWTKEKGSEPPAKTEILRPWTQSPVSRTLFDRMLQSLEYEEMFRRDDGIPSAYSRTFEWIFREPESITQNDEGSWSSFVQWLGSEGDIYWITGKAGSGKSTLMKLIYGDIQTKTHLKGWSSNSDLVTAAFFFWNSGSDLQMSKEGLLRSLLYQAISQHYKSGGLSDDFGAKWSAFALSKDLKTPWTWHELQQALRFLIDGEGHQDVCYAFFVDGLDEFLGSSTEVIQLVRNLASHANVKMCISSRPWAIFEDAFERKPSLMLQYRTFIDIKLYVEEKFAQHPAFRQLSRGRPEYASDLIHNVTTKASGVFLWVVLVVRSLLEGLTEGDRISDLQKRLNDLPDELEELFRKILGSLKPEHLQHACHLFQIVHESQNQPTALTMSFADDDELEMYEQKLGPLPVEELYYRVQSIKRRLDSRCRGLLELVPLSQRKLMSPQFDKPGGGASSEGLSKRSSLMEVASGLEELYATDTYMIAYRTVQYLHRTVKDFIESRDIWNDFILRWSDPAFNPNLSLCRAFITHLKTLLPDSPAEAFWDSLKWAIEHASRIPEQSTQSQMELLNLINSVAGDLTCQKQQTDSAYLWKCTVIPDRHWAWLTSCGHPDNDFLDLAVRCRLFRYLKANYERNQLACPVSTRLLLTAISDYQRPTFMLTSPVESTKDLPTELPDLEIIRWTLKIGANASMTLPGRTSPLGYLSCNRDIPLWDRIVEIFYEFDPTAVRRLRSIDAQKEVRTNLVDNRGSKLHQGSSTSGSDIPAFQSLDDGPYLARLMLELSQLRLGHGSDYGSDCATAGWDDSSDLVIGPDDLSDLVIGPDDQSLEVEESRETVPADSKSDIGGSKHASKITPITGPLQKKQRHSIFKSWRERKFSLAQRR